METRAHHVLIGSFVLAMIGGLLGFVYWAVKADVDRVYDRYTIYFDTAVTGLSRSGAVHLSGIYVGEVQDIEFDDKTGTRVKVTIRVYQGTPINSSSVASLEAQLLTGMSSVQIINLEDEKGAPITPLEKLKGEKHPIIPNRTTGLQNVVRSAPEVLETMIQVLEQGKELLSDENIGVISAMLQDIQDVTASVAGRSDDISEIITSVRNSALHLEEILDTFEKTTREDVPAVVKDVRAAVANIEQMTANLNTAVEENREPISTFTHTALPEITQFAVDARRLAAALRRISEKLEDS
ncbi:MAG: MlaD family protein, partial [Proteobacteria bacterium]|nr:MlaD family protein [Pseudomonadota bacterium]